MNRSDTSRLAVLVVGYKSRDDLSDCLGSLTSSTYKNFTIVFVDNNSEDGSVEYVKKEFPNVVVFAETVNHGFAGGNNVGLAYILENDFSHVFILNPDTVVDSTTLAKLMDDPSEKVVRQPLILLHKDGKKTETVNTAGNILNYMGFAYVGGYQVNKGQFTEKNEIAMASGAGACIPTAVLKKVGLFPDYFFLYHEDIDLFWRIRMGGYVLELVPDAVIWHKYNFSRNKGKFFYAQRNRLFFIFRCYQWHTMLLILPFFLVTEVLMFLFALKGGWVVGKIKADLQFLGRIPKLLVERRIIQKNRIMGDRKLKAWFSAELNFGAVTIPGVAIFNACSKAYWMCISKLV